jgi:hypothetical protein
MTLALAACMTSSTGTTPDAGSTSDAAVPTDADAGGVTVACTTTAVALCAQAAPNACKYPTFDDARAASCCGAGCVKLTSVPCGGYDVAMDQGIDTQTSYYFDHASGKLVAVVMYGATLVGGYTCGGGPASFAVPTCERSLFACSDAGAGDAGADSAGD